MSLDLFGRAFDGAAVVRESTVRESAAARDAGVALAAENAGPTWAREADAALRGFLERSPEFHVDLFAAATGSRFSCKAFGSVVQRAVRAGWMEPTAEYRPSAASNLAPKRVFRSLLRSKP